MGIQMEGKTKYRVAVASSDGKNVDQHFGQTKEFYLFDVEEGKIVPAGTVRTDPFLDQAMFGPAHKTKIEQMVSALIGSDIILTSGFGERAEAEIRARGMSPYIKEGLVNDAIRCAVTDLFEQRSLIFE